MNECHTEKTELQKSSVFLWTWYFFSQFCTQCFMFCVTDKQKMQGLKYFLVINVISMNTHFLVRTTYDEFQSSTKMISQGQSRT